MCCSFLVAEDVEAGRDKIACGTCNFLAESQILFLFCTQIFIAALFVIDPNWKQPKYPSMPW